jgi:hypothetical protein
MYYRRKERGEDVDFSAEELASCMNNQKPGIVPSLVATEVRFS